jgi:macrolide-specific efflux system membrane fusion protein
MLEVDPPPHIPAAKSQAVPVTPVPQGPPASARTAAAPSGPARSRLKRAGVIALFVLAALLVAGGGYYAWQTWYADDNAASSTLTVAATRGNLEDAITATGTLQPKDFVDVGTQVSGQIKRLLVDVGAIVRKGELLAEIDPSVYQAKVDGDQAQLQNQQAQLADREAQLALADLQLKRQQNLMREEATSADALQSAEAARKSSAAQVESLKAQMRQTASTLRGDQANLGYTKIYAPIAGTVVSQAAKQGQTLNANQQAPIVMRIADLSTMTVVAQVSEADIPRLRTGMDVYFTTLGGDKRRFYGKLRKIQPTPTILNNVVLYDALFDVANPNQTLMTQMTAQVFFVVSSAENAVIVPLTALHPVGGENRRRGPRAAGGNSAEPRKDGAEARIDRSETPRDRSETPRDRSETPRDRSETPRDRSETRRDGAETPKSGTEPGSDGSERTRRAFRKDGTERAPGAFRREGAERAPRASRKGDDGSTPGAGATDATPRVESRGGFANGRAMVSVVDDDGNITEREVTVGVVNRVSAQILSGLEPGEKVVIGTKPAASVARAPAKSSLVPNAGGKGGGRP